MPAAVVRFTFRSTAPLAQNSRMSDSTSLPVVRRLLVDLDTPLPAGWNGGDAFRTAVFDALSFSFPAGEQVFIDAVKKGLAELPPEQREAFEPEVRAFIGQEATHRRIHVRYNEHLERRGLVNHWERRILRRRERQLEPLQPRAWLAVTAATEHFTAILAEYLLTEPVPLAGAEPRLRDLWQWHASEESEHRSTAFDLYRAMGGNEVWRRRTYYVVTWHFTTDLMRQVLHHLRVEGQLWRWATWREAGRFLFGRGGVLPFWRGRWGDYLKPDFHPSQGDGAPGTAWLAAHADLAPPVNARAAT